MIGLLPGIDELVGYIPAVLSSAITTFYGIPCNISGIVRQIPAKLFTDLGVSIERWEECRQAGNIWFLDLSSEGAESEPIGDAKITEMWGAMYATGHIEIKNGVLKLLPIISDVKDILRDDAFEPHVTQNLAKAREIIVYSRGCRLFFGTEAPVFAIHMDAELAVVYKDNRARFDRMCESVLLSIGNACKLQSVEVGNPYDLDFTYTDSSKAFTVLKSLGSEFISDPLLIAVRDWHRMRGR